MYHLPRKGEYLFVRMEEPPPPPPPRSHYRCSYDESTGGITMVSSARKVSSGDETLF